MARYTDADALIEKIDERLKHPDGIYPLSNEEKGFNLGLQLAACIAVSGATMDVRENIHAHWIPKPLKGDTEVYVYNCSNCGATHWAKRFSYCPDCGAKMEVE